MRIPAKLITAAFSIPEILSLPVVTEALREFKPRRVLDAGANTGRFSELAAKAGYDPRAAITLWQKMAKVGGKGPPEFLSTHPAPENREKKLAALIPEMMPYYEQKGERPFYKL